MHCRALLPALVVLLASPLVQAQIAPRAGTPATLTSESAPSVGYSISGTNLVVGTPDGAREIALGCRSSVMMARSPRLFVGCDDGTVITFDLAHPAVPEILSRENVGGPVRRFVAAGGQVSAVVMQLRPLSSAQGGAAAPLASSSTPAASDGSPPSWLDAAAPPRDVTAPAAGHVVASTHGGVIVELGADHGVRPSSRLEIYADERMDLGAGETAQVQRRIAIGRVDAVTAGRAHVRLGVGEQPPLGAMARTTGEILTGSRAAPPRPGGIYEAHAALRPFLPLGIGGLGAVFETSVGYRFSQQPLFVDVAMSPFAIAYSHTMSVFGGRTTPVTVAAMRAAIHYDSHVFSAGVGLGFTSVQRFGSTPSQSAPTEVAVSVTQSIRLGALDGIHIAAENTIASTPRGIEWVGIQGRIQIPVYPLGTWLVFRGGGASSGYGFGEIGVRAVVRGRGGRGSIFILPAIGGAGVTRGTLVAAGPSMSFEVEARF